MVFRAFRYGSGRDTLRFHESTAQIPPSVAPLIVCAEISTMRLDEHLEAGLLAEPFVVCDPRPLRIPKLEFKPLEDEGHELMDLTQRHLCVRG